MAGAVVPPGPGARIGVGGGADTVAKTYWRGVFANPSVFSPHEPPAARPPVAFAGVAAGIAAAVPEDKCWLTRISTTHAKGLLILLYPFAYALMYIFANPSRRLAKMLPGFDPAILKQLSYRDSCGLLRLAELAAQGRDAALLQLAKTGVGARPEIAQVSRALFENIFPTQRRNIAWRLISRIAGGATPADKQRLLTRIGALTLADLDLVERLAALEAAACAGGRAGNDALVQFAEANGLADPATLNPFLDTRPLPTGAECLRQAQAASVGPIELSMQDIADRLNHLQGFRDSLITQGDGVAQLELLVGRLVGIKRLLEEYLDNKTGHSEERRNLAEGLLGKVEDHLWMAWLLLNRWQAGRYVLPAGVRFRLGEVIESYCTGIMPRVAEPSPGEVAAVYARYGLPINPATRPVGVVTGPLRPLGRGAFNQVYLADVRLPNGQTERRVLKFESEWRTDIGAVGDHIHIPVAHPCFTQRNLLAMFFDRVLGSNTAADMIMVCCPDPGTGEWRPAVALQLAPG